MDMELRIALMAFSVFLQTSPYLRFDTVMETFTVFPVKAKV